MKKILVSLLLGATFASGWYAGSLQSLSGSPPEGFPTDRVFELRIYTAHDGRLDALQSRFRDHTTDLFERNGMTNLGYWVPQDPERAERNLVVLLAHASTQAADESWAAFRADPDWLRALAASEEDGPVTLSAETMYLDPTDFSPMR